MSTALFTSLMVLTICAGLIASTFHQSAQEDEE